MGVKAGVEEIARDHPEWLTTLINACRASESAERNHPELPEFTFGLVRLFDPSPSVNMRVFLNRGLVERSPRGEGRKAWYVMPRRGEIEKAIIVVESSKWSQDRRR